MPMSRLTRALIAFFEKIKGLVDLLLPAHKEEGKSHFPLALVVRAGNTVRFTLPKGWPRPLQGRLACV